MTDSVKIASGRWRSVIVSSGVERQYVGCAGEITNAVNVVYATYTSRLGHATVAARLYLPAEWADDPHRRKAAKVPEQVSRTEDFRTGKDYFGLDHSQVRLSTSP
jgi:SRSO17 transposase